MTLPDVSAWLNDHAVYERQCEIAHRIGEKTFVNFLDGDTATVHFIARNTPFLYAFFARLDARCTGE